MTQQRICFGGAHLPAHRDNVGASNADVKHIIEKIVFHDEARVFDFEDTATAAEVATAAEAAGVTAPKVRASRCISVVGTGYVFEKVKR